MVAVIKGGRLEDIDHRPCRDYVNQRFSVEAMLNGYSISGVVG